jgi:hypothetical protein
MSHIHTEPGAPLVRASDAERDQAAEVLRAAFAEGRLTRAELDERLAAAYAAKTRADLRDLTGDLPGAVPAEAAAYGRPPVALNLCLLLCLLFAFPPAGIAFGIYWAMKARRQPQPDASELFLSAGPRDEAVGAGGSGET